MAGAEQDAELSGDGEKRRVPGTSGTLGGGRPAGMVLRGVEAGEKRLGVGARTKTLPMAALLLGKALAHVPSHRAPQFPKNPAQELEHLVRISGQL